MKMGRSIWVLERVFLLSDPVALAMVPLSDKSMADAEVIKLRRMYGGDYRASEYVRVEDAPEPIQPVPEASRAFTEERLRRIAEVAEDIILLESWRPAVMTCSDMTGVQFDRILAEKEAALAELKKGMK
jgi:hypothetical protein